jgi:DNA-nicking Smr family endonuclease
MPDKPEDPDGEALWRRVTETVKPLKGRRTIPVKVSGLPRPKPVIPSAPRAPLPGPPAAVARRAPVPGETLDAGWDRRLRRGAVAPDVTIDLHGYTLAAAHAELEAGIGAALTRRARLVLLVTGRAPREAGERIGGRPVRGVIRASVLDWLHHSGHASRIAAVRAAHPRHGGAGALYVVLRREREGR